MDSKIIKNRLLLLGILLLCVLELRAKVFFNVLTSKYSFDPLENSIVHWGIDSDVDPEPDISALAQHDGEIYDGDSRESTFVAATAGLSAYRVFDGVDDNVTHPAVGQLNRMTNGFTIMFWTRRASFTPSGFDYYSARFDNTKALYQLYTVSSDSDDWTIDMNDNGGDFITAKTTAGSLQTGVWQHVGFTWDGSVGASAQTGMTWFVNGNGVGMSRSATGTFDEFRDLTPSTLTIGALDSNGCFATASDIDDFAILEVADSLAITNRFQATRAAHGI